MSLDLNELKLHKNNIREPTTVESDYLQHKLARVSGNSVYRVSGNRIWIKGKESVSIDGITKNILEQLRQKSKKYKYMSNGYIVSNMILDVAKKNKMKISKEDEEYVRRVKSFMRV